MEQKREGRGRKRGGGPFDPIFESKKKSKHKTTNEEEEEEVRGCSWIIEDMEDELKSASGFQIFVSGLKKK